MTTSSPQTDTRLMRLHDPLVALALLTRIPVRVPEGAFDRSAAAAWAYPLVGIVTALLGYAAAIALSVHPVLSALAASAAITIATGAMHEDGLADSADGLWGAWEPARRLEIMKDSHIGTYGTLALIISYAMRVTALSALIPSGALLPALLSAQVLSRAALPGLMFALPNARSSGLSHKTGRTSLGATEIALGIGAVTAFICFGFSAIVVCLAAGLSALACATIAKAKIKGQTGDILGATQQVTEISILITCIAIFA